MKILLWKFQRNGPFWWFVTVSWTTQALQQKVGPWDVQDRSAIYIYICIPQTVEWIILDDASTYQTKVLWPLHPNHPPEVKACEHVPAKTEAKNWWCERIQSVLWRVVQGGHGSLYNLWSDGIYRVPWQFLLFVPFFSNNWLKDEWSDQYFFVFDWERMMFVNQSKQCGLFYLHVPIHVSRTIHGSNLWTKANNLICHGGYPFVEGQIEPGMYTFPVSKKQRTIWNLECQSCKWLGIYIYIDCVDIFVLYKYTHKFNVHRGRLTWNLQITHLERKMGFQTSSVGFHVNLQGSIYIYIHLHFNGILYLA